MRGLASLGTAVCSPSVKVLQRKTPAAAQLPAVHPGTGADTPGTAPDNLASSGSLKLDKPRYDAYLSKKALQAPARGSKFLMTI